MTEKNAKSTKYTPPSTEQAQSIPAGSSRDQMWKALEQHGAKRGTRQVGK